MSALFQAIGMSVVTLTIFISVVVIILVLYAGIIELITCKRLEKYRMRKVKKKNKELRDNLRILGEKYRELKKDRGDV